MAVQRGVHPSAEVLKAFGLGKLNDGSSEAVLNHLEQCDSCRSAVASQSGDDFLNRLRQAHSRSTTPAPAKPLADVSRASQPRAGQKPIPNLPPELAANQQYEILRELGRGGMGVVYLANNKLMDRLEVLKVVNKTLLDHPGAVERFLREIRAAAKLNHANVVAAYSALQMGELLAFAMEYVEGQDLASVVKAQGPLPVPHACFYVQQAAHGLQHAYDKGMVHRDIKPQNLILAREGKKHIVKVLDFGLAKVMREKGEDTGLTGEGKMLGTPDYIAPEQTLDAAHADIRADIYSLGCTLYYLLSGHPPFSASSLGAILVAHQMHEAKPLNLVRPEVPEELAAVVRKMMVKVPAKRYQTPLQVVQALSPFVKQGTTPKAAPELSVGAVEAKAIVKKAAAAAPPPTPVAAAPKPQPQPGNVWGSLTEGSSTSVTPRKSAVIRNRRAATVREQSSRRKWLLGGCLGGCVLVLALLGMWASGVFTTKVRRPDGILIVEVSEPSAEVFVDNETATVSWHNGGKRAEIRVKSGTHKVEVKKDGFTVYGEEVEIEDGKRRILTAKLVRPAMDQPANASDYDLTGGFRFVDFKAPSPRVVLRYNELTQKQYFARAFDLATGQPLTPPLKHDDWVLHASFSPDGKRIVTTSDDNVARVWSAASGQLLALFKHEHKVPHAAFSPDGKQVATASWDKTARVWEVASGQPLTPALKHDFRVLYVTFSPDGKRLATVSADHTACVWNAATGQALIPFLHHDSWVEHAMFSPNGKLVATASTDHTARVWDAATGRALTPLLGHDKWVELAIFSPDGQRVVTVSTDKTAKVWDAATGEAVAPPLKHDDWMLHASFSPDGKRIVTASADKTARIWDATTGRLLAPPLNHDGSVLLATFSPDGKRVATASADNTARLWDAESGKELTRVTIAPPPAAVDAASPEPPKQSAKETSAFFNEKDLTGWDGLPGYWHVKNRCIVGEQPEKQAHTFLCSKKHYRDFDLKFQVKREGGFGNSGVQFRSRITNLAQFRVAGPQCEIDALNFKVPPGTPVYEGTNDLLAKPSDTALAALAKVYKDDAFNDFQIRCVGKHVTIKVNNVTTVDAEVPSLPDEGIIAWQLNGYRPQRSVTFRILEFTDLSVSASADDFVPLPNVHPVVVMETSLGTIKIELDAKKAPATVKNFLAYVEERFYDGTIFHRVIPRFAIQGGGFERGLKNKDAIKTKQKKTRGPIRNESGNDLSNVRGSVAMARSTELDSAAAQFFINVADNKRLDEAKYCVFGKVIAGMDVVDRISGVKTRPLGVIAFENVPVVEVVIKTVRRTVIESRKIEIKEPK